MKWAVYSILDITGIVGKRGGGAGLQVAVKLDCATVYACFVPLPCRAGEGVSVTGIYEHVCVCEYGGLTSILDKCMAWCCTGHDKDFARQ